MQTHPHTRPHARTNAHRRAHPHAHRLRQAIKSVPPGVETIALMDRLSDVLCSVVDLSEFVRHTHPNPAYVQVRCDAA